MASFKESYRACMGNEGGYANDKDDTGGETYKGISRNNFPRWAGWPMIDAAKKSPAGFEFTLKTNANLEFAVQNFYKKVFWDGLSLDLVTNQAIATELFDSAVNVGTGKVAEWLQITLNVTNRQGKDYPDIAIDRQIGPATVKVLNGHPKPVNVLKLLNCFQGVHYATIVQNRPVNEKFMTSWLSRVQF